MALADPDLRHGAPAALLLHFGATLGLEVDADLFDARALRQEQSLRRLAERARRGRVHQHPRRHFFSTGRPACCHAPMPPERLTTRANPCFFRTEVALPERSPLSQ